MQKCFLSNITCTSFIISDTLSRQTNNYNKMTRKDYMSKKVSHQDYYNSLATIAGVVFGDRSFIKRCSQALENGDEHLNTISLERWDNMSLNDRYNTSLVAELKKRGDSLSLSVGVCMRKAKMKEIIKDLEL